MAFKYSMESPFFLSDWRHSAVAQNCTTSNKCRLSSVIKKGRKNPPRTQGRVLKMESMKMTASFSHLAERKEPAPKRAAVSRRYAIFISTGNRHCDL
ncbi:hypothetical protein [Delftia acidovorans]|uniref:hypothetical protein n=1 Tax=Delftia acidovorans TaxID=80866 RepID=UPI002FDE93AE